MTAPLTHLLTKDPALFSVPAGVPFAPAVAGPILEMYADEPLGLADLTIYLPTRRAVRALSIAFAEQAEASGSAAAILPRLQALGDVSEEDLMLGWKAAEAESHLRPPASTLARRFFLAQLIKQRAAAETVGTDWPAALRAADSLASLLDEMSTAGVDAAALTDILPPDLRASAAAHWQASLDFIEIVTKFWPLHLEAEGQMDSTVRRLALMDAMTDQIMTSPPPGPVLVAGSLGAIPAAARFMAAVASLPQGGVIFPGVDLTMDRAGWEAVDPPHPQAIFRERLADTFQVGRDAVEPWPPGTVMTSPHAEDRRAFLSLAMRPADATADWYAQFHAFDAGGKMPRALDGLKIAVARSEQEEASFVSWLIREALETPRKTVMLVTPDRNLARRVARELLSWGIEVDDSGGVPAGGTMRGTFLRLVAAWLDAPGDPHALLALLKHELCQIGLPRAEIEGLTRQIDTGLRGAVGVTSWETLVERLTVGGGVLDPAPLGDEVTGLMARLAALLPRFEEMAAPTARLAAHLSIAESLADGPTAPDGTGPEEAGAARLWRFEDGEHLAQFLSDLLATPDLPDQLFADGYAAVFEALLASAGAVRKRGAHPCVAIYGVLEARLQAADRVILSGLTEGSWPDAAATDPFLSRPMRAALGLPSPERVIGRAAHDFVQGASCDEVILTRSEHRGRAPASPSRWMVRLESFIAAAGHGEAVDIAPKLRAWDAARHGSARVEPFEFRVPKPPIAARPTRLSVSDIDTLVRDPYGIYAKNILRLRPFRTVGEPLGPREFGTLIHLLCERCAGAVTTNGLDDGLDRVPTEWDAICQAARLPADQVAAWKPKVLRAQRVLAAYERQVRPHGAPVLIEEGGSLFFDLGPSTVEVVGRVDRADRAEDGGLCIVDFKTGTAGTVKQENAGYAPQLTLMALMAAEGGFALLGAAAPTRAGYIEVGQKEDPPVLFQSGKSAEGAVLREMMLGVRESISGLLSGFLDPDQGYPSQVRPFQRRESGDYDHLARRGEWAGESDDAD